MKKLTDEQLDGVAGGAAGQTPQFYFGDIVRLTDGKGCMYRRCKGNIFEVGKQWDAETVVIVCKECGHQTVVSADIMELIS